MHGVEAHGAPLGATPPAYSVLPFVLLLLAIAILPLVFPTWWERLRNRGIVSLGLALPVLLWLLLRAPAQLLHTGEEYLGFMALLASLFVICGGILITGDLRATPRTNTTFLAIGAVLANLIGTTGASMLLIRPMLETNAERRKTRHIPIFFIFLVSNVGGSLTPLGDPPLFLGYLRGVPFTWTLSLFPEWLLATAALLAIFFAVDTWMVRHETRQALRLDRARIRPLRVHGVQNFALLLGVLGAVFLPPHPRIAAMLLLAAASYVFTRRDIHVKNRFTFHAIQDVALLFAGIFIAMVPALLILEARGAEFGIREPWQFFWLTGGLSSFLDNAPTYLTFSSVALSVAGGHDPGSVAPLRALLASEQGAALLRAISLGSVWMGANTYIGNGPNFMVKSIVEERRIPMPGFFGYMLWSVGILVPLFLVMTWIFFR